MSRSRRPTLLLVGALAVLVGMTFLVAVLPGVRICKSMWCGYDFDPGGLDIFGRQLFTPAQTAVIALGTLISSAMLAAGLWLRLRFTTAIGIGALVVTVVAAIMLPSVVTGSAPSVPCSTPGSNGRIEGTCIVGTTPMDARSLDRALIVLAGLAALALAAYVDRRRPPRDTPGRVMAGRT
ncbi:MAG: hypothetical protein WD096_01785 [Actinomycetota bacterium]